MSLIIDNLPFEGHLIELQVRQIGIRMRYNTRMMKGIQNESFEI